MRPESTYIPSSTKHEFPPNNSTNQNIELYKNKLLASKNNHYNYGYNLVSPEQPNFNNFSFIPGNINNNYLDSNIINLKSHQYYEQHPEYFSPSLTGEMRQNYINKINNNNYKLNLNNSNLNKDLKNVLIYKDNNDTDISKINSYLNEDNAFNNNKNNYIKKEEKNENNIEDPDEYMFREEENKNEKNSKKDDEESELSPDSDKNSDNEKDFNDHLLAQYEKVKRVKNKWKVTLKGSVVQQDNKEYICGKIHGELEREW